jgi:hypothetical protein
VVGVPETLFMNKLLKLRLILACCMALGLSTIAAFGQDASSPTTTTDHTSTGQTTAGQATTGQTTAGRATTGNGGDQDNHSNWGWIGLAGLLGLAGLMKRRDTTDYDRVGRSDNRREARV